MMVGTSEQKVFKRLSAEKAFDRAHRAQMNQHTESFKKSLDISLSSFKNLENAKRKAHLIKWRVMENLDRMLPEFESNFQQNGGKVLWANDASEALEEIQSIISQENGRHVLPLPTLLSDEIGLTDFLKQNQITVLDLAANAVADTVVISSADFLLADTGAVVIAENDHLNRPIAPKATTHIVLAGIEKVIPSFRDLDLFLPLLSTHSGKDVLRTYHDIIQGSRKKDESDGPDRMYVILIDNGRTDLLAQPEQREGLYCIQCGACLNVCPVFQNIGKESYQTTYAGPIGSLITPHTQGMQKFQHLSQASTLCGQCTAVCPVKINIDRQLVLNRRDAIEKQLVAPVEKWSWKMFIALLKSRKKIDLLPGKIKSALWTGFFKRKWGKHRKLPSFAHKSFSQQWKEKQKK